MRQSIVRQFTHENWAHVFLYAAIFAAKKNLASDDIILPLEVKIDGYVLGKIVEISVESDRKELAEVAIRILKNYEIDKDAFGGAAGLVAIKNGWRVHLLEDELEGTIRNINATAPWVDKGQLELLCEDENDEDLAAPGVRYETDGPSAPVMGFRAFVDDCQPELRALAVLVINSLVYSVINEMNVRDLPVASVDTVWAEGLPVVGVAVTITSTEDVLEKLANIRQFFDDARDALGERRFGEKLAQIIVGRAGDISGLFCADEIAWYSGVVVGTLGWKSVATEKNVQVILDKIRVEVL